MINLNNNWDLSLTMILNNQNNEGFSTKLPGCFDVNISTGEKLKALAQKLTYGFTVNTYIDSQVTAQRSLNLIIDEDEEET